MSQEPSTWSAQEILVTAFDAQQAASRRRHREELKWVDYDLGEQLKCVVAHEAEDLADSLESACAKPRERLPQDEVERRQLVRLARQAGDGYDTRHAIRAQYVAQILELRVQVMAAFKEMGEQYEPVPPLDFVCPAFADLAPGLRLRIEFGSRPRVPVPPEWPADGSGTRGNHLAAHLRELASRFECRSIDTRGLSLGREVLTSSALDDTMVRGLHASATALRKTHVEIRERAYVRALMDVIGIQLDESEANVELFPVSTALARAKAAAVFLERAVTKGMTPREAQETTVALFNDPPATTPQIPQNEGFSLN